MNTPRIELAREQQRELEDLRDHAPKAYVRERAAALLKLAAGQGLTMVAEQGLLRRRDRHTVLAWLRRYQAEGVAGLGVKAGRGRKPAFFPPQPSPGTGRG
jgi:transposase